MSKPEKAYAMPGLNNVQATDRAMLVLERELVDTLSVERHVRLARLRLDDVAALSLVDSLKAELQSFIDLIRRRLHCRRPASPHFVEHSATYSCLFETDSPDPGEQFRGLLSGYVHYERRTIEAIACLEWSGDFESADLVRTILPAIERTLCVLEIHLEELALRANRCFARGSGSKSHEGIRYNPKAFTGTSK